MDAERLQSRNEAAALSLDFKVIDMFVFCAIKGKKKKEELSGLWRIIPSASSFVPHFVS